MNQLFSLLKDMLFYTALIVIWHLAYWSHDITHIRRCNNKCFWEDSLLLLFCLLTSCSLLWHTVTGEGKGTSILHFRVFNSISCPESFYLLIPSRIFSSQCFSCWSVLTVLRLMTVRSFLLLTSWDTITLVPHVVHSPPLPDHNCLHLTASPTYL